MNKPLLLGTALLVAISAFPQTGKLTKPSGVLATHPKKLDFNESTIQNTAAFSTPTPIKHVVKANTNGNKTTGTIPSVKFTGSMNVNGYLVSQSKPLQYNKGVNAVSMIARKNGTYSASSNSNSGTIVGLYTTNLGTTWNETCIWSNGLSLGRYPQGGIYNPFGNNNINNAYLVGVGPFTSGTPTWGGTTNGQYYCSKQITTPGNTTSGSDQQANFYVGGFLKKHYMPRMSFTAIDGGIVRTMGNIVNDPDNTTTNLGFGLRGAVMVKGTFNAGVFVWSVDSFVPPLNSRSDGSKLMGSATPLQAWDEAGVNGYVVIIGSRSGTTPSMKGFQPIVYKTTTSGASWSLLPPNDFADPSCFTGVFDRTYPVSNNTVVISANFTGSEGCDAVVDANGQLHFGSMVYGHYYNHVDSLGYQYVFGSEQWSYGENGPFNYPVIYDFYTRPTGGWDYHMVDSMGTEGPSGTSGQPGYGSNLWSDGSGGKMAQDARIQMSRTTDGQKIFYSWTETDTCCSLSPLKWNIYPGIKWKGYDVTSKKVTPRMDATVGDANVDQLAYYHYMCNKAVGASSVCMTMPFTITSNAGYDGSVNVDTYFLGDQACPTSFSINAMSPKAGCTLGLTAEHVFNFDVMNFPNPAEKATTIVIGLKKAENFEVVLYSSVGQILNTYKINGQLGANEINVDLSNYSAGVYFYNVKIGNSIITKKLIVQ